MTANGGAYRNHTDQPAIVQGSRGYLAHAPCKIKWYPYGKSNPDLKIEGLAS
jgi:hypothetical protein